MTKKISWAVVVVIIIIIIFISKGGSSNSGPIKIGFLAPMSGDTATFGTSLKGGLDLALKEINSTGGVHGRQIEVVYEDSKCNGKDAATAAQKLISIDKVKYLIGMICSGEVLGVAPISEQNKVFILVQGSSPDISRAGKYIVRTSPSDLFSGKALADFAIQKGFKTASIITENTDYSINLSKAFEDNYKNSGGKVLDSEQFNTGTTDFRAALSKIKATGSDILFINPQSGGNAARIAKQAKDLGIKSQFVGAFFTGPEYIQSGPAVNGTYIVDVPALDASSTSAGSFVSSFKSLVGIEPPYPFFAAATYDQLKLLAQAFGSVGSDNTDAVRDYIHSLASYTGIVGTFHFDDNGDVVGINHRIVQVQNNKVVSI